MLSLGRWLTIIGGGIIFAGGLIMAPLPIPAGLPMIIIGLAMMASHPRILRIIRAGRARFPQFSNRLKKVTPHAPGFLRRFLKRTEQPVRDPRKRRLLRPKPRPSEKTNGVGDQQPGE